MEDTFSNLFENLFKSLNHSYEKENELAAIWITEPVLKNNGNPKCRYAAGDKIKLVNGKMIDHYLNEDFTHRIVACYGNIYSTVLNMAIVNLRTMELEILKIK